MPKKTSTKAQSGMSGLTSVVGGMLVGLDEQLLRSTPRVEVLVKRGQTVRGTSSQGGSLLVGLPDDPIELPNEPARSPQSIDLDG